MNFLQKLFTPAEPPAPRKPIVPRDYSDRTLRAIAWLGDRWCLARTNGELLRNLKLYGDLL